MSACVDKLLRCLEGCDILPPSTEESLLDRVLDSLDYRDPPIRSLILSKCLPLGNGTAYRAVVFRLVCRVVPRLSVEDTRSLARQCSDLLDSPPSLQDAIWQLLGAARKRTNGEMTDWSVPTKWIMDHLADETMSIYVRKRCMDFLKLDDDPDVRILDEAVRVFSRQLPFICDSLADLLLFFQRKLTPKHVGTILDTVRSLRKPSQAQLNLLLSVGEKWTFEKELSKDKWKDNGSRLALAILIMNSYGVLVEETFRSLSELPFDLSHVLSSMNTFHVQRVHWLILRWRSLSPTRIRPSELSSLLSFLLQHPLPPDDMLAICRLYEDDILREPSPFLSVLPSYPNWRELIPGLENLLSLKMEEGISSEEWEHRDAALSIHLHLGIEGSLPPLLPLVWEDPSPYVRASAIRCVAGVSTCVQVIQKDSDNIPRLEAARILRNTEGGMKEKVEAARRLLRDEDIECRREGLRICEGLHTEEAVREEVTEELSHWREDDDVGEDVRRIMGEEREGGGDRDTSHLVTLLIQSLNIHSQDQDCY